MRFPWSKEVLRFEAEDPQFVDVKDLALAREWYEEKFGWPVTHVEPEPDAAVVFELGDVQGNLALTTAAGPSPMPVLSTLELDHVHRTLGSRGVVVGPMETASSGRRHFRLWDLEGNVLEIFEPPRESRGWRRAFSWYRVGAAFHGLLAIGFACFFAPKFWSKTQGSFRVAWVLIWIFVFALGVRFLVAAKTGRVPRWAKWLIDSD